MPSSVVGTCTTRTPRSQVAATKPARSVTAPPPSDTTASERVKARCPSSDQSPPATSTVLAASPSGTAARTTSTPPPSRAVSTRVATSDTERECTSSTCAAALPTSEGSSSNTPAPTTTSYGDSPVTAMRVVMPTPGRRPRRPPRRATCRPWRPCRWRPVRRAVAGPPSAGSTGRAGCLAATAGRG